MSSPTAPFSFMMRHPRKVVNALVHSIRSGAAFDLYAADRDARESGADQPDANSRSADHTRRQSGEAAGRQALEHELTPISRTLPEDIFIAGYPKSGNTWFNQMVAGLVYGVLASKSQAPFINDLIPDVHQQAAYKRYRTPTFFKTHHLPRPEYRNVVYLLRDGRDAMVSYWHFQRDSLGHDVDFLKMVRDGEVLFPCKWHDHVAAWMSNPHQARMIVIRYEDLLARPVTEMERFCRFCNLEIDRDFIRLVVENASFKNAQAMGQRFSVDDKSWTNFIRRGVAGSHRDEMPAPVLEAFLEQAGDMLRRYHYLG
jgi:hypothetical protein